MIMNDTERLDELEVWVDARGDCTLNALEVKWLIGIARKGLSLNTAEQIARQIAMHNGERAEKYEKALRFLKTIYPDLAELQRAVDEALEKP